MSVHVMFGVGDLSDTYNQHVGVAITSIAKNCSLPVVVHILCDIELNKDSDEYSLNKEKYSELSNLFNVKICYHDVKLPDYVKSYEGVIKWNSAAYLRLFAHEVVDEDWVLYLDGDVIVNCDLIELWNDDVMCDNFAIGAVLDRCLSEWEGDIHKYHENIGLSHEHYFNSGVLLMNLKKIREKYNFTETVREIFIKYDKLPFPDQDLLNIVFFNDVKILPNKYNCYALYHTNENYHDAIIHYIGEKPWRNIQQKAAWEYWEYLRYSPWGNTVDSYMTSISHLVARAPLEEVLLTGRITSLRKCFKSCLKRIYVELFHKAGKRW